MALVSILSISQRWAIVQRLRRCPTRAVAIAVGIPLAVRTGAGRCAIAGIAAAVELEYAIESRSVVSSIIEAFPVVIRARSRGLCIVVIEVCVHVGTLEEIGTEKVVERSVAVAHLGKCGGKSVHIVVCAI